MTPAAAQVFVYYRVRAADVTAVIDAVRTFQADLPARIPGLKCALSRRADDTAELVTLLESYGHSVGVGADWRSEIERCAHDALAARIVGERHIEVFVPCA